jgi:DNA-binding MarR family transcriptional regulator
MSVLDHGWNVSFMTMGRARHEDHEALTLLEVVLQLHGELRRCLESIRVTPLQAGVLLFLRRHVEASMTNASAVLRVTAPTLSEVVKDLVRRRWVTKSRSVTDTRVVHLRLSRLGHALTRQIEPRVCRVDAMLAEKVEPPSVCHLRAAAPDPCALVHGGELSQASG